MDNDKYVVAKVETNYDLYGLQYTVPTMKFVSGFEVESRKNEKGWGENGLRDNEPEHKINEQGLPRTHKVYVTDPREAAYFSLEDAEILSGIFNVTFRNNIKYSFVVRQLDSLLN